MCSKLNNLICKNPLKRAEYAISLVGITLAKRMVVKRSITYREITVAIGILVAAVIVMTLWIKNPETTVTGSDARPVTHAPMSAQNVLKTTLSLFTGL